MRDTVTNLLNLRDPTSTETYGGAVKNVGETLRVERVEVAKFATRMKVLLLHH